MKSVKQIIKTSRNIEDVSWSIPDVLAKSIEELGEFSEAVQVERGLINKECPSNEEFREAADVMICMIDILCKLNPHMTEDDIYNELNAAITKKTNKWENKFLKRRV